MNSLLQEKNIINKEVLGVPQKPLFKKEIFL